MSEIAEIVEGLDGSDAADALNEVIGRANALGHDPDTTTGSFYGYKAGSVRFSNGDVVFYPAGTIELDPDGPWLVYIDQKTRRIKFAGEPALIDLAITTYPNNTLELTPAAVQLARVVTVGGVITGSPVDMRPQPIQAVGVPLPLSHRPSGDGIEGGGDINTPGAYATATLTYVGQPTDGDTVTIGSYVYTFRNAPSVAFDVEIGGNASTTYNNLASSIMDHGYLTEHAVNPEVDVTLNPIDGDNGTLAFQAKRAGSQANGVTLVVTIQFDMASLDHNNLTGGVSYNYGYHGGIVFRSQDGLSEFEADSLTLPNMEGDNQIFINYETQEVFAGTNTEWSIAQNGRSVQLIGYVQMSGGLPITIEDYTNKLAVIAVPFSDSMQDFAISSTEDDGRTFNFHRTLISPPWSYDSKLESWPTNNSVTIADPGQPVNGYIQLDRNGHAGFYTSFDANKFALYQVQHNGSYITTLKDMRMPWMFPAFIEKTFAKSRLSIRTGDSTTVINPTSMGTWKRGNYDLPDVIDVQSGNTKGDEHLVLQAIGSASFKRLFAGRELYINFLDINTDDTIIVGNGSEGAPFNIRNEVGRIVDTHTPTLNTDAPGLYNRGLRFIWNGADWDYAPTFTDDSLGLTGDAGGGSPPSPPPGAFTASHEFTIATDFSSSNTELTRTSQPDEGLLLKAVSIEPTHNVTIGGGSGTDVLVSIGINSDHDKFAGPFSITDFDSKLVTQLVDWYAFDGDVGLTVTVTCEGDNTDTITGGKFRVRYLWTHMLQDQDDEDADLEGDPPV